MPKRIKVSHVNQTPGFENGFFFKLLDLSTGASIEFVPPDQCDLLIIGPFKNKGVPLWRRTLRKLGLKSNPSVVPIRSYPPLTLYQTWENTCRYESYPADYTVSQDLGVAKDTHHRLPLWMAILDWSHEGLYREKLKRFGSPITIKSLMTPIGMKKWSVEKAYKGALITTHLKEPRSTLLEVTREVLAVDGFGPAFDKSIADHNKSSFIKSDVYASYGFALCPENSTYPGYYTEKIPEAYACGCLPITWADSHVAYDFNSKAIINLWDYAATGYSVGLRNELEESNLKDKLEQPLLVMEPSLAESKKFLSAVLSQIV